MRALGRRPSTYEWDDLPNEIWRPILGFEGIYEVSDQGRVKSLARIDGRGHWRSTVLLKPALVGPKGKQYLGVHLSANGDGRQRKVHLLVLETFVGPRPTQHEGAHENGNKCDNRLMNLAWKTRSENSYDKQRHGTDHQKIKTHCPQGHEYTPENCYDPTMKKRRCKTCARDRANAQWAKGYRSPGRYGHKSEA
jgi:hypothetical protein